MKFSTIATAAALVLICSGAHAGEFGVECYADVNGCADVLNEVVTSKFTSKYPLSNWRIVVIAEFQRYSDGGGVGYAVAGVVPKGSSQVPVNRFSATLRVDNTRKVTAKDRSDFTLQVYRDAVAEMMAACDESSTCDLYIPHK
jgi:hypothetical protein